MTIVQAIAVVAILAIALSLGVVLHPLFFLILVLLVGVVLL